MIISYDILRFNFLNRN